MKIVSFNTNGIRSAIRKGMIDWLKKDSIDLLCIQETKATAENIDLAPFYELGYKDYWFSAEKKGYSGVAVFTKEEPTFVQYGNGMQQSDKEGRVLRLDFGEKFTLINAYFPSGTSGAERQQYKYQWLDEFNDFIRQLSEKRSRLVITGDYNICHKPIDIHDPKGNKNSSGFLPEERAWMDRLFDKDFLDTYRLLHPDQTGAYTWWSQRFPTVRLQNKGWRIDYITISRALKDHLKNAAILHELKFSDHCPITAEFVF